MFRLSYKIINNLSRFHVMDSCFDTFKREPFNAANKILFYTSCKESSQEKINDPVKIKSENKKKSLHITLIGTDGRPSTSTLENATKLSKRRDLKLIKVSDYDPRWENPVYKLLSEVQILQEDIHRKKENKNKKTGYKTEKIISFSHKISDHDINSKVKQILKWLSKLHEIRATISGTPEHASLMESVYQKIEAQLGSNGRILQKRNSEGVIKFVIIPPKSDQSKKEEKNKQIIDEKEKTE